MIKLSRRLISTIVRRIPRLHDVNRQTLLWCVAASVVVASCLAWSQLLIGEAFFNSAIINVKAQTNRTLKHNVESAKALETNVNKLLADEVLAPVRVDEGDNNFRVVLDALPVTGDPATFANSLQGVILKGSNVTITKLSIDEKKDLQMVPAGTTTPRTLRFSVEIAGDYTAIKTALSDIEKSIRPIHITSFSMVEGTPKLTAKITGVTYYLPEKSLKLKAESVKRP